MVLTRGDGGTSSAAAKLDEFLAENPGHDDLHRYFVQRRRASVPEGADGFQRFAASLSESYHGGGGRSVAAPSAATVDLAAAITRPAEGEAFPRHDGQHARDGTGTSRGAAPSLRGHALDQARRRFD